MKPCPFCGGEAVMRLGYDLIAKVACIQCGASTTAESKRDKNGWSVESDDAVKTRAVEKWEMRTPCRK